GHAVGKLLDGDHLGDHDLALDLLLCLRSDRLLLLALLAPLQRCQAPLALLFVERVGDGQAAADSTLLATPRRYWALLVAGLGRPRLLFLLLLEEVLAGRLLAFLPRFGLRLMALILFTLPLVGLLALFGTLLLRHRLRCGDLLGPRALCGLALARISERTHARVLLLLGELRQHHASTVRLSFLLRSLGKERPR